MIDLIKLSEMASRRKDLVEEFTKVNAVWHVWCAKHNRARPWDLGGEANEKWLSENPEPPGSAVLERAVGDMDLEILRFVLESFGANGEGFDFLRNE